MHFKRALEGKHSQNKKIKNKIHKVTTRTPRKVKDLCILGHLHPPHRWGWGVNIIIQHNYWLIIKRAMIVVKISYHPHGHSNEVHWSQFQRRHCHLCCRLLIIGLPLSPWQFTQSFVSRLYTLTCHNFGSEEHEKCVRNTVETFPKRNQVSVASILDL